MREVADTCGECSHESRTAAGSFGRGLPTALCVGARALRADSAAADSSVLATRFYGWNAKICAGTKGVPVRTEHAEAGGIREPRRRSGIWNPFGPSAYFCVPSVKPCGKYARIGGSGVRSECARTDAKSCWKSSAETSRGWSTLMRTFPTSITNLPQSIAELMPIVEGITPALVS